MTRKMVSKITYNIRVSVIPEYDCKNSNPSDNRHVFKYYITIENLSDQAIQVIKRRWLIYDMGFGYHEIDGEGVIGLTPEIESLDNFTYFSNVILRSGIGTMMGIYVVKDINTGEEFDIEIPKFQLFSDIISN